MRPMRIFAFLGTFLALAGLAEAQTRITCSSRNYQYQRCSVDTSGGVRLVEQLSRSECRPGTSWGYDPESIWVTNGCSAVFEVSSNVRGVSGRVTSARCDRVPVLYADSNFRGQTFDLERSVSDLHPSQFGDVASSICVPAYWTVTLFQDSQYRGARLPLEGPYEIADLKRDRPEGQDWGDRVSSAEVRYSPPASTRTGPCDRTPMLFADDSFRGKKLEVTQSISDTHSRGLGDNISSLCVPRGWQITVYEDKGFRGASLELRGPASILDLRRERPNGREWGDTISSVRVDRRW